MTDEEWYARACADAQVLNRECPGPRSERKLRLLSCACLRHLDVLVRSPDGVKCIEACERYADGHIKGSTLLRWRRLADALRYKGAKPGQTDMVLWYAATYLLEACGPSPRDNGWLFTAEKILREEEAKPFPPEFFVSAKARFALFLRDLFANLFHPVPMNPLWRSNSVLAIAKQMYDTRDFSAMPILGDALQDADCADETVLAHCSDSGPHIRGCWVVDWILDKK